MYKRITLLILIASLGVACKVGPNYKRAKVQTPSVYRGVPDPAAAPDPKSLADAKWFEVFKDERLQELIRQVQGPFHPGRAVEKSMSLALCRP